MWLALICVGTSNLLMWFSFMFYCYHTNQRLKKLEDWEKSSQTGIVSSEIQWDPEEAQSRLNRYLRGDNA